MNHDTRDGKEMGSCSCKGPSTSCCPPSDGNESSCCSPGNESWKKRKALISVIIIMAAIGVGVHSLVRRTSAQSYNAGSTRPFSAALTEIPAVGTDKGYQRNPQSKPEEISLNRVLDSLQPLETLAADKDVVFLVLPGEAQSPHQKALDQVGGVVKNLWASGQKVGVFTLKCNVPDHGQLVRHFAVKTLPCVVVLGRQGSASAVEGEISESRLYSAFVLASKPGACCPGQNNPACCPK